MIKIGVIGYGYVGQAIANRLSKFYDVACYDCDKRKVEVNGIIENLLLTNNDNCLTGCNVFVVTVQTPIDDQCSPNLDFLIHATEIVAKYLNKGGIVIYESTVYPGVTENICGQLLEKNSGLKLNKDFYLAYSPERISPGDKNHCIENIAKIIAASNDSALQIVKEIYSVVTDELFLSTNIMEAEATKLLENLQRDVNIALMNEYALVMKKLGISISNVIEAAKTKWNFNYYLPGFVGGHCIGIDTYYYIKVAKEIGIVPHMALTSRETNEKMIFNIAELAKEHLVRTENKKVCIVGVSYKENIDDIRNSASLKIADELSKSGCRVLLFDPIVNNSTIKEKEIQLCEFDEILGIDMLICLVYHNIFDNYCFSEQIFNNPQKIVIIDPYNKILKLSEHNIFSLYGD